MSQIKILYNEAKELIGQQELERKLLQFLRRIIKKAKTAKSSEPSFIHIVDNILSDLNKLTGLNYRSTNTNTQALIRSRLNEGFTVSDFNKVNFIKTRQWLHNDKMRSYLAPSTLYRPTKFERYLQEYYIWKAEQQKSKKVAETKIFIHQEEKPDNESAARIREIIQGSLKKMRMPDDKK